MPAISKRSAKWLLGVVEQMKGAEASRVAVDLKHALRLRPGLKLAKVRRTEKRTTKKEARASVREAVARRAGGRCEACGRHENAVAPLEADHMWGRARSESLESVWLVCRPCHRAKTDNSPTRAHWLTGFRYHCERHGYDAELAKARNALSVLQIRAQAEAVSP